MPEICINNKTKSENTITFHIQYIAQVNLLACGPARVGTVTHASGNSAIYVFAFGGQLNLTLPKIFFKYHNFICSPKRVVPVCIQCLLTLTNDVQKLEILMIFHIIQIPSLT